jgi:hypothetical protein
MAPDCQREVTAEIKLCKSLSSLCDLDLGGWGTCVTHNISFYHYDYLCHGNPLIYEEVMDVTQNIQYNRHCGPLTSECDIDFGGRGCSCCTWHIVLLLWLFVPSYFKNRRSSR